MGRQFIVDNAKEGVRFLVVWKPTAVIINWSRIGVVFILILKAFKILSLSVQHYGFQWR